MTYKLNPFTGKLDTSDGPQGPAGVVSAAGPGSQGTPSISFAADLDTGLYNYTANGIAVSTGGTGRLFIDSSGRVGVGVSTGLDSSLQINGQLKAGLSAYPIRINTSANVGIIEFPNTVISSVLRTLGETPLTVEVNSAERLRITSDGKVGVGTSAPRGNLHIDGAASAARIDLTNTATGSASADGTTISIDGSTGALNVIQRESQPIQFYTAATERLRITADGKLGLGTSSPSNELVVRKDSASAATTINIWNGSSSGTGGAKLRFGHGTGDTQIAYIDNRYFNDGSGLKWWMTLAAQQGFKFLTDVVGTPTEALTIDSSGNVGIGTTAPTRLLTVQSTGNANFCIKSANTGVSQCMFGDSDSDAVGNIAYFHSSNSMNFEVNGLTRATIDSSGRLLVGTSTTAQNGTAIFEGNNASATGAAIVHLAKGNATPADGDFLGALSFTDSGHVQAARVSAHRDGGTWTSGSSQPTRLVFSTTADGASSPTARMTIKNDGKVGINTENPDDVLDVRSGPSGFSQFVHQSGQGGIRIAGTGASSEANLVFSNNHSSGTSDEFTIKMDGSTDDLLFIPGGPGETEVVRIDSSGRLLVGASSNFSHTDANGNTDSPKLQVAAPTSSTHPQFDSSLGLYYFAGGVGGSRGNSIALGRSRGGVGTQILVTNNDNLGELSFHGSDGSAFRPAARIQASVDGTSGANDMPGRLVFSTTADGASSPTERMRIASNGEIITGSTDDVLNVSTSVAAGTSVYFFRGRHSGTVGSVGTGTTSVIIYTNGDIVNTNNSYGALSDIKLKENIVDANSQWDDLKALQVRNYNLKEGQTHTQIGLIAQEVELVSPGLVSESPDRDAEGNDLGTVTKSVNYSVLYMKAVKALQEAMDRIETLEQRLTDAGIA
jgi:hypothetical protein